MKNIIGLILFLASASSFAQNCTLAPQVMGQPQRCWDGRPVQQVVQGQQVVIPQGVIQVPVGNSAPQGYCSWEGRVTNVGISSAIGGFIGLLTGGNHRAVGKGAAAGASVGLFIPCDQGRQGGQAPVMVAPQGQSGVMAVASPCGPFPGTKQGVLNLPGNAKHGQTVCALPGDTNISQWLDGTPSSQKPGACQHQCPQSTVPVIGPDGTPQCRPSHQPPKIGEKSCS